MEVPAKRLAFSYRDAVAESIGENRLEDALNTLQDFVSNLAPDLKQPVLLLRRRYRQFQQDALRNLAPPTEADQISVKILEIVTEAERQSTVSAKYNIPTQTNRESPAVKPNLRLISTPVAFVSEPLVTGTLPSTLPAGQIETIEEQLRQHWARYRASQTDEDTAACVCETISKRFRQNGFCLEQSSFSLKIGQITGVVGRNASGKTTLLRILLGEILPNTGTVRYPALSRAGERWQEIKRRIGYIPQFPDPWNGRLKTNLHFLARVYGTAGKRNRDLIEWHLHRYGLTNYQDFTWSELAGGFRTRYELVRALICRPRLLILDEPLASLDVAARQEFLKNLRVIAYSLEDPVPIIVTSQHLYEIEAIADQMIVLDDGKVRFCGPLADIELKCTTRLYELNTKLPRRVLEERLHGLKATIVDTLPDGYVIETPLDVKSQHTMEQLVARFGNQLVGIRDITSSSRRFFLDQPLQPQG
jgi:ABC-2 type transport system ATP-binding protein